MKGITLAVKTDTMEEIVSLCKRRGFVYPSSEIYGGFESFWDYGPLGIALKRNVREAWWHNTVRARQNVVGVETGVIMNPNVWHTTGHASHFADTLVECTSCHQRFRVDHLEGDTCPNCDGAFTEPRRFLTMFKTHVGPVEDDSAVAFMRPETAQGMFVNFKSVLNSSRLRLPFGIAQIGKSYRNEITTGNFIFRQREFEQMELEFFCEPGSDDHWHAYWLEARRQWYLDYGVKEENLRLRQHGDDELAFYAKYCWDIEYRFPFGWGELEGISNRTDYDLRSHSEATGQELTFYDEEKKEHVFPYVIEPAAGADRALLTFLLDAYDTDVDAKGDSRVVLRFHPFLAPIKAAILPLVKKGGLPDIAREIVAELQLQWDVFYDESGSIGRRYRRQDEVGTPFGITVDFDTKDDNTVTVRHRDSMEQERVPIGELVAFFAQHIRPEPNPDLPGG